MKRTVCWVLICVLVFLIGGLSSADMSTVLYYQELQEKQETLYYQHLGQWFSLLNRIYVKDHVITEEEQEKLKQLYADLFKDVKDIAQSSADGDAEYWADLFKVDTTPETNPDDEKAYENIIELTFNAYQDNLATVSKLEESAENFWGYAFETGSFNVEKYRRAIAIITELDNVIQSLHPSKEMAEEANKP